jgi:curli production assembly/transport component CsgG
MSRKKLQSGLLKFGIAIFTASLLSGCAQLQNVGRASDRLASDPIISPTTRTGAMLQALGPPTRRIDVAVYGYEDKTGQNEEGDNLTRFSRAVSQGGEDVLYDILEEVGDGQWFNVVERAGLQELLTERELINETARVYRGASHSPLQPLRFAGTIIRGGVIDYDTNILTGGAGARILGIGANSQYREDRVAVAIRAVSVQTGEVLASVMTEKTIYSVLVQGSAFRYVAADELLELDLGVSQNEPTGVAVRHAMELAVFALILEGAEEGVWSFADQHYQAQMLEYYVNRRALDNAHGARLAMTAEEVAAVQASPETDLDM